MREGMLLNAQQGLLGVFEMEDAIREDTEDAIDHGRLVSHLAVRIAEEMEQDDAFCQEIEKAGLLHDIGKLKLGQYLYGRRYDTLQVEEMKYIRQHPRLGAEILRQLGGYSEFIIASIYHHHENFDGSGYPENVKGNVIPFGARILRVCDVFAALVSERPYRAAFEPDTAVELMIDEVKNFDMRIFIAFLRVINAEDFSEVMSYVQHVNQKCREKKQKYKEQAGTAQSAGKLQAGAG